MLTLRIAVEIRRETRVGLTMRRAVAEREKPLFRLYN